MRPFIFSILFCIFAIEIGSYTYDYYSDGLWTSIHVLVINPQEESIRPVKANGCETVAAMALTHGAAAGVNGGFYKENGDPAGILKIDNTWHGIPKKPRGAIGWSEDGVRVLLDRVLTNDDMDVVSAMDPPNSTPDQWSALDHIVGGTPLLINHAIIIEDYSSEQTLESFLTENHPRTAVGIREDGCWIFVVVDGRFLGMFGGMTMRRLAEYMLSQGCVEALNLCGGCSSTMVIEGKVANYPCGDDEKAVGDAILIFPK